MRSTSLAGAFLVLLLLAPGCPMTESQFYERFAEARCDWVYRCFQGSEIVYDGRDACELDAMESEALLGDAVYLECEFEPDLAAICLEQIEMNPCTDPEINCSESWICEE